MEIIVYADESGTFDKVHNEIFVFGGVIYLSKKESEEANRKYISVENTLRKNKCKGIKELKACLISNEAKGKIFRSLNDTIKFGVIIKQKKVLDETFLEKKSKQRFLDYAFKIGLKRCLQRLINEGRIVAEDVDSIMVYMDEHSTATNGRYELRESLEQEFKIGTFNMTYNIFYKPLFPKIKEVNLQYCNSANKPLIRAADIVANRVYHCAITETRRAILHKVYLSDMP